MLLPISLTAAGALALLHIWLSVRVSQVRRAAKVSIGDGGVEPLARRMRAHGNFAENAPFFLVLLALLELAGGELWVLWGATILFVIARLCHAFGMDRGGANALRAIVAGGSWLVLLGLAGWAIVLTYSGLDEAPARQQMPAIKA